ncbi:hypothetical protein Gain_0041_029 [Komagataeibacter intermedius TF2]|nr:hypothetical protein Gain_0041_029 [Komagataeibacter intermedius TF2]
MPALTLPRIGWRIEMGIYADAGKREFCHGGATDTDHARLFESQYGRRIRPSRRRIGQYGRSGLRDRTGFIKQVLYRKRNPGKKRQRPSGLPQPVCFIGGPPCRASMALHEGTGSLARRIRNAFQASFNQFPA